MEAEINLGESDWAGAVLQTQKCFLCLGNFDRAVNKSRRKIDYLSKYLGIDVNKLLLEKFGIDTTCGTKVKLCGKCVTLNDKFEGLYKQLERIRMEVAECLREINCKMNGEEGGARGRRISKKMATELPFGAPKVLRDEILEKSTSKLVGTSPQVIVQKLPLTPCPSRKRKRPSFQEVVFKKDNPIGTEGEDGTKSADRVGVVPVVAMKFEDDGGCNFEDDSFQFDSEQLSFPESRIDDPDFEDSFENNSNFSPSTSESDNLPFKTDNKRSEDFNKDNDASVDGPSNDITFVATNRGGKLLVCDGFRYRKNGHSGNRVYFACCQRCAPIRCKAIITVYDFDPDTEKYTKLKPNQHEHNHNRGLSEAEERVRKGPKRFRKTTPVHKDNDASPAPSEITFEETNRGGKLLVCDGFRYRNNGHSGNHVYYACCQKDAPFRCKAVIVLDDFQLDSEQYARLKQNGHKHNHPIPSEIVRKKPNKTPRIPINKDDPQPEISFTESYRGNKLVVYNNFLFQKRNECSNSLRGYFCCTRKSRKGCRATLILYNYKPDEDKFDYCKIGKLDHNHDPDTEAIESHINMKKAREAQAQLGMEKKSDKVLTWSCNLCTKVCSSRVRLLRHTRIFHLNMKPEKCNKCGLEFNRRENLLTHQQKCQGPMNYPCEICGSSFKCKDWLGKHIRLVHRKKQKKMCQLCGALFVSLQTLQYHIKKKHPDMKQEQDEIPQQV